MKKMVLIMVASVLVTSVFGQERRQRLHQNFNDFSFEKVMDRFVVESFTTEQKKQMDNLVAYFEMKAVALNDEAKALEAKMKSVLNSNSANGIENAIEQAEELKEEKRELRQDFWTAARMIVEPDQIKRQQKAKNAQVQQRNNNAQNGRGPAQGRNRAPQGRGRY